MLKFYLQMSDSLDFIWSAPHLSAALLTRHNTACPLKLHLPMQDDLQCATHTLNHPLRGLKANWKFPMYRLQKKKLFQILLLKNSES